MSGKEYYKTIRQKIGHDLLLLVGSNVIIEDAEGRILLQQRLSGSWGLPGGLLDIGETLEETAIREVREETGLEIDELELLHTFSGPDYHFTLENKDEIYVVTALYKAKEYNGKLKLDRSEGLDLKFFSPDAFPTSLEGEYRTFIDYHLRKNRT